VDLLSIPTFSLSLSPRRHTVGRLGSSWSHLSARSAPVALLFSLTTKWWNTPSYMLVYISPNFSHKTELSSNILFLCSQKLRLHVTWTLRFIGISEIYYGPLVLAPIFQQYNKVTNFQSTSRY
jgi:hypothetical protein